MATRILHFGSNDSEQLMALARFGYAVEPNGESIPNFQKLLQQRQFDAIFVGQDYAHSINKGTAVDASGESVPLILFAGANRNYSSSDFDFVVPPFCSDTELMKIAAELIDKGRAIQAESRSLRERSASLREQAARLKEESIMTGERLRVESERSQQQIASLSGHESWSIGAEYKSRFGSIVVCSLCKKTRRVDDPTDWEWVPAHLDTYPPVVSHGLCPTCQPYILQRLQKLATCP